MQDKMTDRELIKYHGVLGALQGMGIGLAR